MASNPFSRKKRRSRAAVKEELELEPELVAPEAGADAGEEEDTAYYPSQANERRRKMRKNQNKNEKGLALLNSGAGAYKRIVKYLKPYKWLFILGLFFGVAFGGVNGLMVLTVHHVTGTIFPKKDPASAEHEQELLDQALARAQVVTAHAALSSRLVEAAAGVAAAQTARPATARLATAPLAAPELWKANHAVYHPKHKKHTGGQKGELIERASTGKGAHKFNSAVLMACLAVPGLMLLRNFCGFMNSFLMLSVGMRVLKDIRNQVFAHIMGMSLDFFDQSKSGELIQLVYGRTRMIQNAAVTLASDVIRQPFSIIAALGALFIVDWKFTLGVFLLFPLCLAPVLALGRMVRRKGEEEERQAGQLTTRIQESFSGIRTVKAFGREEFEQEKFSSSNNQTLKNMMRWMRAMEAVGPIVEVVASIGVGAALLYSFYLGSVEKFIALQMGMVLLYPPFKTLSRIHIMMQKVISATDEIFLLLDSEASVQDAPDAKPLQYKKGEIRFENVTFSFRKGVPAVRGVNLTFEPGKFYALVGETGAGKSTLFSLLMRMYDPQEGTIYLDGQDIRQITQKSLRDRIGLVNQQNFLFGDTISNNIRYGRIGATQEEIEQAARHAHAHEFIIEQESGYETEVGDAGQLLSGGQRQRICIARTFLKDAPILLLDEATSALDAQTEEKIKEALDDLVKGRTVISIAHRFSSLLKADEIIVMEKGKVRERGTHEELYARGGRYKRLYDLQFRRPGLKRDQKEEDPYAIGKAQADEFENRLEAVLE
jgi:subfamily B ATP-binding cassette protein MsbA